MKAKIRASLFISLSLKLNEYDSNNKCLSIESYNEVISAFSGNWQELYFKLDNAHKQAFWKSTIKDIFFIC